MEFHHVYILWSVAALAEHLLSCFLGHVIANLGREGRENGRTEDGREGGGLRKREGRKEGEERRRSGVEGGGRGVGERGRKKVRMEEGK